MQHLFLKLSLLVSALMLFSSTELVAQDSDIVCAAIFACDSDGQVSLPYRNGACAEFYARQCASELANSIAAQLSQCQETQDLQQIKIRKLQAKNRRLNFKLRAAHDR